MITILIGAISFEITKHYIDKYNYGEDLTESISVVSILFIINVFYSLGWILNLLIKRMLIDFRVKLFIIGTVMTIIILMFPAIILVIKWEFLK